VRLAARVNGNFSQYGPSFQFQIGAIGSQIVSSFANADILSFNSRLVRLAANFSQVSNLFSMFQFQIGAIGSRSTTQKN